jgi:hypothetical protein
MSNDRQLLYQLILAIDSGSIDEKLAHRRIGTVHQARWLTLASRILRLYISVPDHLGAIVMEKLERLSIFIVQIYFKVSTKIEKMKYLFMRLRSFSVIERD